MMNRRNIGLTETTHTKWRNLRQNSMSHSPKQVKTIQVMNDTEIGNVEFGVRGQELKKISLLIILKYIDTQPKSSHLDEF